MSVLIILLIASLTVSAFFLGAFLWSMKNRQFDDPFSPAHRILFDDPHDALKDHQGADASGRKRLPNDKSQQKNNPN